MARSHGKDVRVYLDGRDMSCDLNEIGVDASADTHDVTTFCSDGWKANQAGLIGWEANWNGFYDPAAAGYGRQMESLLGAAADALSIYDGDADAIGDSGIILGPGVTHNRSQPMSVSDMVKLSGTMNGFGRAGLYGKLLHVDAEETGTGEESSLDNGGSSANGGRGNLHVTAITGTWTIKIQDSANNIDWADLIAFTQVAAAGGVVGESLEVTGTVDQYLRVTFTEDVAGSITFACGFARY